MKTGQVKYVLEIWLLNAQKIVIIGVGNPLRRDDGVGVKVTSRLEGKVSDSVYLIESETVPENSIEPIIEFKPTHILVIDAALMNIEPGSAILVENWEESAVAVLTHSLPIQLFCAYLKETTNAKIALLLIQPKDTDFGEGLTSELEKTVNVVASYLLDIPGIGKD